MRPEVLEGALRACERTAEKDRSSLYLVSQHFRDPRRYEAFIAMYSVMRVIDDRVDAIQDVTHLVEAERMEIHAELRRWRRTIGAVYEGGPFGDREQPFDVSLAAAVRAFPVPRHVWASFLDAMTFDVDHDRFATVEEFLRYAEGATVSPTTVFV